MVSELGKGDPGDGKVRISGGEPEVNRRKEASIFGPVDIKTIVFLCLWEEYGRRPICWSCGVGRRGPATRCASRVRGTTLIQASYWNGRSRLFIARERHKGSDPRPKLLNEQTVAAQAGPAREVVPLARK